MVPLLADPFRDEIRPVLPPLSWVLWRPWKWHQYWLLRRMAERFQRENHAQSGVWSVDSLEGQRRPQLFAIAIISQELYQ